MGRSEESRVKKVILSIERAVECEDVTGCMWHIAGDYSDDLGMDYRGVAFFLKSIFETADNLSVHIKDMRIDIKGREAQTSFVADIRMAGRYENEAGASRFNVSLRKDANTWKVDRVELEDR